MNAHELAKKLLEGPNIPIATHAHNHTYMSGNDSNSHGALKIGVLYTYGGDHIIIGDFSDKYSEGSNWYVKEVV